MPFPTTNWNLLAIATLSGDSAGREALKRLCECYYEPIRRHLRSRGYTEENAQDGTQQFFQELLVSRAWKRVDGSRGRFRSFLLGTLSHVLSREQARNGAEKRGGGQMLESLDEMGAGTAVESVDDSSAFDRAWALRLMELAMTAVERGFAEAGQGEQWAVLVLFLPGAGETPAYDQAAERLGVSLGALKTSVFRVRQSFRQELRAAVARTVSAAHEIDDELAYLHQVLSANGG